MGDPVLRRACVDDLAALLRLAGEAGGATASAAAAAPDAAARAAFDAIDGDPDQMLVVADAAGRGVCAVLHLSFEPAAPGRGERRARLLGLRVDPAFAQAGLGRRMHDWAVERARERGLSVEPAASDAPAVPRRRPSGPG